MTIGGDPEFFERPEWIAVREAYGLRFAARRNFSPTFMYNALTSGEADVIGAYTSDGRIAADDLVILDEFDQMADGTLELARKRIGSSGAGRIRHCFWERARWSCWRGPATRRTWISSSWTTS